MQGKNYKDVQSNLRISDEVIATIARCATKEIEGVASLTTNNVEWRQMLFHPRVPRAIFVDVLEGVAYIDINIVVKYGYRITDVAVKIQNAVKSAVQNMTGVKVAKVNVHVADITFAEGDQH